MYVLAVDRSAQNGELVTGTAYVRRSMHRSKSEVLCAVAMFDWL